MHSARQNLLRTLAYKSFRLGEFKLSSGGTSDYYVDCRTTTLDAKGSRLTGEVFLEEIRSRGWKAEALGGLTMGADPVALARRYRDRIAHIHTKDVRKVVAQQADSEDWSFLDSVLAGVYTVPGDGTVDYVSVFRELPDYTGWIVIEAEQDTIKAHPATNVKMGFDNLNRFIAEAGLKH